MKVIEKWKKLAKYSLTQKEFQKQFMSKVTGGTDSSGWCRGICYADASVNCDTWEPDNYDGCMSDSYVWCDGYCYSGT